MSLSSWKQHEANKKEKWCYVKVKGIYVLCHDGLGSAPFCTDDLSPLKQIHQCAVLAELSSEYKSFGQGVLFKMTAGSKANTTVERRDCAINGT